EIVGQNGERWLWGSPPGFESNAEPTAELKLKILLAGAPPGTDLRQVPYTDPAMKMGPEKVSGNPNTVFGDAAPDLTSDDNETPPQEAEVVRDTLSPVNSGIQPSAEPAESGVSAGLEKEIREVLSTIDDLNRREDAGPNSPRSQRWGFELKLLVSHGSEAVPSIIRELDQTRDDRMIASLAFALRAIGDKRGVPALIRAIPRIGVPLTNCNFIQSASLFDKELVAFFQAHKLDGQGPAIGCSDAPTEVANALRELTGQKFALSHIFGLGMPRQVYLQKQRLHRDAQRWAEWWEANSGLLMSDADYASVNLPPLSMNPPEPVDVEQSLAKAFWRTGNQLQALQIVADTNEQARVSFLDLDTGRSEPVPEAWRGRKLSAADRLSLFNWAEDEGYDLVCDRYERADGPSHYAFRGIGLKAWQLDDHRWDDQSEYISLNELTSEGRKVADDWLLPLNDDTLDIDPTATAPFVVVTREGSPVLVYVGAETTEIAPANQIIQIDDLHRPTGFVIGRKLEIKLFEPLRKK
ncbi:MAG: hypothetical protein KDA72_12705, partial [Planctomycetales bacterium]|nr:hypothetical protein [Planctomycetales bacterium]